MDRYCNNIESLLQRIRDSELLQELAQLFYEFVAAVNTSEIEPRILLLWNFLEHITHIYSAHINRNLLIEQNKFQELKEKISQIIEQSLNRVIRISFNLEEFNSELNRLLNKLNENIQIPIEQAEWRSVKRKIREQIRSLIKNEYILIEGYNIERIQTILIKKIDDFPPIKSLIDLMCRDINYNLNDYEERTINIIYYVRNYLFHRSIRLKGLYEKLIEDFTGIEHFNFTEFEIEMRKFEELIRKITAKIYQSLLFKEKREISPTRLHTYHSTIHQEPSSQEHFINLLNGLKSTYTQQKKYSNIIRLILRNIGKYNGIFNDSELMRGCCYGERDKQIIRFQLEFKYKFHAQGRFNGNISYPQQYIFFINMRSYIENSTAFLKFRTLINISSLSNVHNVYINLLDFWLN